MESNPSSVFDQPAKPKSKSRWFQYRLRTLMVFVTLAAMGMSWFAVKMQRARRQREAVERMRRFSGMLILYDYQFDAAGNWIEEPPGPLWLRKLIGDDLFINVIEIIYWQGDFADANMENLEYFPQLRSLCLCNSKISDAGLEHIKDLKQLQELDLAGSEISDLGLKQLKGLKRLKRLWINDTKVTNAGIEDFKRALSNVEINPPGGM